MALGRARLEWDQTAALWCLLINANRDTKEHPKPFMPWDIHPHRTEDDYKTEQPIVDAVAINKIKRSCKVTRLQNVRANNPLQESASQTG